VATSVVGSPTVTPVPAQPLGYVVAIRDVPSATKFENLAALNAFFKDVPLGTNVAQTPDAVNSIYDLVTTYTNVLSPTTGLFTGTIQTTQPIRKGSELLTTQYRVLPISPLNSIAYGIGPGRVAETIQATNLQADNLQLLPGDFVDILLTIRQHEVKSLQSNPPGSTSTGGALETQQLIAGAKILAVGPAVAGTQTFTLELSLQDAVLLKYVKDTVGTVDLVVVSSQDVKNQAVQPRTHAVFPEYFTTPEAIVKGTPQGNGVLNTFVTPLPTPTVVPTVPAR
jgi:Flp pilus assembly protein CpaB